MVNDNKHAVRASQRAAQQSWIALSADSIWEQRMFLVSLERKFSPVQQCSPCIQRCLQQCEDRAYSAEPGRHLIHSLSTRMWRSRPYLHVTHTEVLTLTVCTSALRLAFCRRRSDLMNPEINTAEKESFSLRQSWSWCLFKLKIKTIVWNHFCHSVYLRLNKKNNTEDG